jgi:hypothetical protein
MAAFLWSYSFNLVKVFGSFGMAAIAVNGTGTYGVLRKVLFLSLQAVVIGPFNAEATHTE